MKRHYTNFFSKSLLLFGCIWLFIGSVLLLADWVNGDEALLSNIAKHIESDFHQDTEDISNTLQENPDQFFLEESDDVYALKFNKTGQLTRWSSQNFIPNDANLKRIFKSNSHFVLAEKSFIFYCITVQKDSFKYACFFPLNIQYPIKNDYLEDFLYLGRYNKSLIYQDLIKTISFRLSPESNNICIKNPDNHPVFYLTVWDISLFRFNVRLNTIISFSLGIFFFIWGLTRWLSVSVKSTLLREVAIFFVLFTTRALLLLFHLPGGYVDLRLFSPTILAINEVTPSLGDLTLNVLLILILAYRVYRRFSQRRIQLFMLKLKLIWVIVLYLLTLFYFIFSFNYVNTVFDDIVINTRLNFDFADLSQFNLFSYIIFIDISLILVIYFLLIYFLVGVWHGYFRSLRLKDKFQKLIYFISVLILVVIYIISYFLFDKELDYTYGLVNITFIVIIFLIRRLGWVRLKLSLMPAIVVIGLLAFMTNFSITRSLDRHLETKMRLIAEKFSRQNDLITEYLLNGVVQNIKTDPLLFVQDSTIDDGIERILNNHLLNTIKGYDFHLFVFDVYGNRIDDQPDIQPYRLTWQERKENKTLSEYFYNVKYSRSVTKGIYVGQFRISTQRFGDLYLQIELYPKNYAAGKLYPQLLLDQQIRQKLTLPRGYVGGIYQNGQLIQTLGSSLNPSQTLQVPIRLALSNTSGDSISIRKFTQHQNYVQYLSHDRQQRTVLIRVTQKSTIEKISSISFLFYFYFIIFLLIQSPDFFKKISISKFNIYKYSLTFKLQSFLVIISFLSLLVLWFLSSTLFKKFYYSYATQELHQTLEQVSGYIARESVYLEEIVQNDGLNSPFSRDFLSRIGDLISCDLNIYNTNGILHNTTKPRIYHTALSSVYINPTALLALLDDDSKRVILLEKIGKLTYLSGYAPLFDSEYNLKGILNIPYLSQQDLLNQQIEEFITYLINIYVLLLFILILISLFLSQSITLPLTLLKQKLDETNLGGQNERIHWHSNDEIGALISSYNNMVEKLAENEVQLAKSERELAWREMARQIAHEIKNPLTPMRLQIQQLERTTLQKLPDEDTQNGFRRILKMLITQIDSLTGIANSFSRFASMPSANIERHNLNVLIDEVYSLYKNSEEAEVRCNLLTSDVYCYVDKHELTRALVNLVKNALQAMQRRGVVTISLEKLENFAQITIKDNGKGIPAEIQPRIFEPNFSTKTSGMGLGLAITQKIITAMDGTISFESEEGVGTSFYIRLPLKD